MAPESLDFLLWMNGLLTVGRQIAGVRVPGGPSFAPRERWGLSLLRSSFFKRSYIQFSIEDPEQLGPVGYLLLPSPAFSTDFHNSFEFAVFASRSFLPGPPLPQTLSLLQLAPHWVN